MTLSFDVYVTSEADRRKVVEFLDSNKICHDGDENCFGDTKYTYCDHCGDPLRWHKIDKDGNYLVDDKCSCICEASLKKE